MSYHAVIEPIWCQENRCFFSSSLGLTLSDYGQSTFESEYLFLNCPRMWNGFLCLPGQHSAVHRDSPGLLSFGCSQDPGIPWRSMVLGAGGAAPLLSTEVWLRADPPRALPWRGWCISAHFWSKVTPMHLPAGSFSHLSAVMGTPSVVGVAVVSQSRSDLTCAQVQHSHSHFWPGHGSCPSPSCELLHRSVSVTHFAFQQQGDCVILL